MNAGKFLKFFWVDITSDVRHWILTVYLAAFFCNLAMLLKLYDTQSIFFFIDGETLNRSVFFYNKPIRNADPVRTEDNS